MNRFFSTKERDMRKFTLLLIAQLLVSTAFASWKSETNSHREVYEFVLNQVSKEGISPKDALIVYDIDNTLLKMKQNFGSDQWFNWQSNCLKIQCPELIAKDFQDLIDLQYEIFTMAKMDPTEDYAPQAVRSLQEKGFSVIALTSRGPESRNATERELRRNNYDFSPTFFGESIATSFTPTGQKRIASYQNGVFMTSGMHKGQMLKYLLDRFQKHYKFIMFIDDHKKHTDRVFDIFLNTDSSIYTFRYGLEDNKVENFNLSDKAQSIKLGRALLSLRGQLQ